MCMAQLPRNTGCAWKHRRHSHKHPWLCAEASDAPKTGSNCPTVRHICPPTWAVPKGTHAMASGTPGHCLCETPLVGMNQETSTGSCSPWSQPGDSKPSTEQDVPLPTAPSVQRAQGTLCLQQQEAPASPGHLTPQQQTTRALSLADRRQRLLRTMRQSCCRTGDNSQGLVVAFVTGS